MTNYSKPATTHTSGILVQNGAESAYDSLGFKAPLINPNGTISENGYTFCELMRVNTFQFPYNDNAYGKAETELNVERILRSWNNFDQMKETIKTLIERLVVASCDVHGDEFTNITNAVADANNLLRDLEKPVNKFGRKEK